MKTLTDFESRQPVAVRFFEAALKASKLVNAYVIEGKDLATAYAMILRLGQIINCQQKPDSTSACGNCQPCRWIESNAHPGILTVSNLTFTEDIDPQTGQTRFKGGKLPQKILVSQITMLLNELKLHSGGFQRVVILTGAEELPPEQSQQTGSNTLAIPPRDWAPVTADNVLALKPLDRFIFADQQANKFLKTLEEPPLDTIFFLLTDASNKLLDTIVSRCQTVPLHTPADFYARQLDTVALSTLNDLMGTLTRHRVFETLAGFNVYIEESGLPVEAALLQLSDYLWAQGQSAAAISGPESHLKLKSKIKSVDDARQKLHDRVREDAVLESLFLGLTQ